jgi:voltage-gated potassium channel
MTLLKDHEWVGKELEDVDISRQSYIVMVKRANKSIIPRDDLILTEGDKLYIFDKRSE